MNNFASRQIFKSSAFNSLELQWLLETLFYSELVRPSNELWLVFPWVSDVRILDNRTGAFLGIDPLWPRRDIRLSDIVARLLIIGTRCRLVIRPDRHNEYVLDQLHRIIEEKKCGQHFSVVRKETLHAKGLLGDQFFLSGSMNLTYNGIAILDEFVELNTNRDMIAQARIALLANYGQGQ